MLVLYYKASTYNILLAIVSSLFLYNPEFLHDLHMKLADHPAIYVIGTADSELKTMAC